MSPTLNPEVSVPATAVMEVPSVRPQITEYQLPALTCGRCGVATLGGLQSTGAMCTGACYPSRSTTVGVDPLGVGSTWPWAL